jgi:hypothetical protein
LRTASRSVELDQLVGECRDVGHVILGDRLDLPLEQMEIAYAASVVRLPFERSMLGMDVELDAPPYGRHGEVDASSAATRQPHDT